MEILLICFNQWNQVRNTQIAFVIELATWDVGDKTAKVGCHGMIGHLPTHISFNEFHSERFRCTCLAAKCKEHAPCIIFSRWQFWQGLFCSRGGLVREMPVFLFCRGFHRLQLQSTCLQWRVPGLPLVYIWLFSIAHPRGSDSLINWDVGCFVVSSRTILTFPPWSLCRCLWR